MRADEKTDLLQALPKEERSDPTGERLAELLDQVSRKKLPASSFSRMWILGSLPAKITCGHLAYWLRSLLADADDRLRLRKEARLHAALELLGTMGYLRGAVMKIGQTLASFPMVMPEEFADLLAALHFEAPPMHYALVREVFLDEFGSEPEEVFATFERRPFAAASLGQVHRATLPSGEEVAVKIQYPDIARTIRADLRNLRLLIQPLRMSRDWPHLPDKLADIEQMLMQETDYRREARFGQAIRELFTEADRIAVPRVFERYSTGRVLTTEYLRGCHLAEFLASQPDQRQRDHFTALLTSSTLRIMYQRQLILADPHPGNFLFLADGRLGLLDFGCIRAMSAQEWGLQCEFVRAMIEQDGPGMDRAIARACLYSHAGEMEPERLETVGRFVRWQLEPWQHRGPFDFGDEDFFRRGMHAFFEVSRRRFTRGVPLHLWGTRFILGARAITYRLQGHCDFFRLYEEESAMAGE